MDSDARATNRPRAPDALPHAKIGHNGSAFFLLLASSRQIGDGCNPSLGFVRAIARRCSSADFLLPRRSAVPARAPHPEVVSRPRFSLLFIVFRIAFALFPIALGPDAFSSFLQCLALQIRPIFHCRSIVLFLGPDFLRAAAHSGHEGGLSPWNQSLYWSAAI
jgi:hypothetical protein